MKIVISPHAREMILERAIDEEWVRQTLAVPLMVADEQKRPGRKLAFARIAEFGDRWLRVVYTEDKETINIITAFFDRRAQDRYENAL